MTEQNPHKHNATCRQRASFTNCGRASHQHLQSVCYDRAGRLTCGQFTHQHTTDCYPWIFNCGYPA